MTSILDRASQPWVRSLRKASALVLAAALLVGCGTKAANTQGLSEVMADYEATAASLAWPTGRSWKPADKRYAAQLKSDPGRYQPGYGRVDAGLEWLCAWKSELLDAAKTQAKPRVTQALTTLGQAPTLDAWRSFDTGTQRNEQDALAAARLGDYSKVAQDVEASC